MSEKAPLRVTISQAANLFGINEKTVRRAISNGEVLYIVVRGVYKIHFESLLKWSQNRPKIKNKLEKEGVGQFVDRWKIKNKLYSPNPEVLPKKKRIEKTEEILNSENPS
jgi:excisionase family DNA binding protein